MRQTLKLWETTYVRYCTSNGSGAYTFGAWKLEPTRSEVDALNSNTSDVTYTTLADLYNDGVALSGNHTFKFITITSDVTNALTSGSFGAASRGFMSKADTTTIDAIFFNIANAKIFIVRISNATTVSKCVVFSGS